MSIGANYKHKLPNQSKQLHATIVRGIECPSRNHSNTAVLIHQPGRSIIESQLDMIFNCKFPADGPPSPINEINVTREIDRRRSPIHAYIYAKTVDQRSDYVNTRSIRTMNITMNIARRLADNADDSGHDRPGRQRRRARSS